MAEEVLQVRDDYYILAASARMDDRTRVLKSGDTFAVFDRFGNIERYAAAEFGLYHQDTRFLSGLVLRLEGERPLLLSSTIKDDNAVLAVDLTNPDVRDGRAAIPRGSVHIFRSKVLWNAACHERLRIHNYGLSAVDLRFSVEFEADFADIFEVRGVARGRRGRLLPAEASGSAIVFSYEGLDGRTRRTRIDFDRPPSRLTGSHAQWELRLEPRAETAWRMTISCEVPPAGEPGRQGRAPKREERPVPWYEEASGHAADALARARAEEPDIDTSNEQFNDWVGRSLADLRMMRTETEYGPYPYAGVPWFSTCFGRDGIVAALQCLWHNPAVARGVLGYLAATQADQDDPGRDAQPGKVLHETRGGEMAALGEVPFRRYYGSVDATPLFVVLAGAYFRRTGDRDFARAIWPHVERALAWMDRYGDADGDGFVEYARHSRRGLEQQGWKDSQDSVFHRDGALADGPIALCEVQAYAYAARGAAAALAAELGNAERARELSGQGEALRRKFEEAFWDEELSTYVLALDGAKRPCRVRTSNAGHCLFAGIAGRDRAARVAAALLDPASFSGWGIRTVAATEARYNPASYHNGSIWPHDNSLIGAGFGRYGLKDETATLLGGMFDASLFFDLHRLPELFCGFPRRPGESPTLYPVSCAPQSWASGAPLLLLQACLGMEVLGAEGRVEFRNPFLPPFLKEVRITGLRVGEGVVDLLVARHGADSGVNVLRREGAVTVVAIK